MRDSEAVARTLYDFARGIDTRDWELLRSVFCPVFDFDYTSHREGSRGRTTPAEWVAARARRFGTMRATRHTLTGPRVQIDGDRARCRMSLEAWHLADVGGRPAWCTIGGEYDDVLRRTGDRWLISELRLERRWTMGDPAVLDLPTG